MSLSEQGPDDRSGFGGGPMLPIEDETGRGFRFIHIMLEAMQQQNCDTRMVAHALAQFLIARGLVDAEEWQTELERARGIDIHSV